MRTKRPINAKHLVKHGICQPEPVVFLCNVFKLNAIVRRKYICFFSRPLYNLVPFLGQRKSASKNHIHLLADNQVR